VGCAGMWPRDGGFSYPSKTPQKVLFLLTNWAVTFGPEAPAPTKENPEVPANLHTVRKPISRANVFSLY